MIKLLQCVRKDPNLSDTEFRQRWTEYGNELGMLDVQMPAIRHVDTIRTKRLCTLHLDEFFNPHRLLMNPDIPPRAPRQRKPDLAAFVLASRS